MKLNFICANEGRAEEQTAKIIDLLEFSNAGVAGLVPFFSSQIPGSTVAVLLLLLFSAQLI